MKKSLVSMLGAVALGVASMLPNEGNAEPRLRVVNYTGAGGDYVEYIKDGMNKTYTNTPAVGIYDFEQPDQSNSVRSVNIATNSIFTQKLYLNGPISKAITNNQLRLRFYNGNSPSQFISTFPSNILITAKIVGNGYTNTLDVVQSCLSANKEVAGVIKLPEIPIRTNSNRIIYATSQISFTTKESSLPKLAPPFIDLDKTNAAVTVDKVLPGENIILESTTNLNDSASWLPVSTSYVGVTTNNFGEITSTTFTNLPAIDKQRFFRAKVQ